MTTNNQSSVDQSSDKVKRYICNACEDKNVDTCSADFYCKQCDRLYCRKCIYPHSEVFAKHNVIGSVDMDKWLGSKKVVDFLQTCENHKNNKLDKFCNIHEQLCCPQCVSVNHSQCKDVIPISELINKQFTDLQALIVKLEPIQRDIESLQNNQEARIHSLQETFTEHEGYAVQQMILNISTTLDKYANITESASDKCEQNTKEEMCNCIISFLNTFDNNIGKELKEIKHEVISLKTFITNSIHNCFRLQAELTQYADVVQKIGVNKELCFLVSKKCEYKIQQALTVLGKSDHLFTILGRSMHNISIPSDSDTCSITAICVLPDEQVLVADSNNNKVKLLNHLYQVVSHCEVAAYPWDITQITLSEVAVTVDTYDRNIHEVQFITVNNSQLVIGRKLQLQHSCRGITHHLGDLFITSDTALYKYSLSGKLISKLFKDTSGNRTVYRCVVSPTGDKLYIINNSQHKLLTLARDGAVLAIFTDPDIHDPDDVNVTPAGQVLVCGGNSTSYYIIQVDCEGRRRLATLATHRDGVDGPLSVCYDSVTDSIIVGLWGNNILVFKVQ